MTDHGSAIQPAHFRDVLGQYPTGVVAVTALDDSGGPLGMILGSFGSVSLDPPLVSFMPGKSSSSWARLAGCERYCINVLGADQEDVCRGLTSKQPDKFTDVAWTARPGEAPEITGSLAYIHCLRDMIHDAGDHHITICRVERLAMGSPGTPLLFYRGGYGTFTAQSLLSSETELMAKVRLLDRIRDLPEGLARDLGTEVSAVALVKNEVVLIGSFGRSLVVDFPSRVGQYLPFMPPIGGVFAAWGPPQLRDAWMANAGTQDSVAYRCARDSIVQIRRRGYALGLGHEHSLEWERAAYCKSIGDARITTAELRRRIAASLDHYNPPPLDGVAAHEFHFAQAPIFDAKGEVSLALTLWGPLDTMQADQVRAWSARLLDIASQASLRIGVLPDIVSAS